MKSLARAVAAFCVSAGAFAQVMPFTSDGRVPTLAPMLSQVTPAVVNISATMRDPAENNPLLRDPFFRRFFDLPDRPQQSAGSGVIVDARQGVVLTNNHVVKDAQEVAVTLKDRRQFKARVVGTDAGTDIAVLRIPAEALTALKFGDSDALNVGDFVVAIGNPFGIGQTVTSGIVSALGRSGLGIEGYEDFIQTDASINPGNSGGALVNLKGELVGINTAILGPSGGNIGIGFAVPVSMARAVLDQILRFGEVRRGRIGVSTQDLTPELARQLGLSITEGAVIVQVERGSAAESAGLRPKDVVTAINGRAVRTSGDLRNRIGLTPVGEEVELQVLRAGKTQRLRTRIAAPFTAVNVSGESVSQLSGAKVANIEPGMPMHGRVEGIIVTEVDAGSPAFKNGLRAGDILYGVNRRRVRNLQEFASALRSAERPLRLSLLRGEYRITLLIR